MSRAALVVPALVVPALVVPALAVPALAVPALVVPALVVPALLASAPLTPDAAGARALARRELAGSAYAQLRPGLWSRLLSALGALLDRLRVPDGAGPARLIALLVVLAIIAGILVLAARRIGRVQRRSATLSTGLATSRSADDLRAAADAAAATGDYDLAVTERFRALVRAAQARDLVRVSPGLTAGEAAEQAGAALPDLAVDFRRAGALFDAVVYGRVPATAHDDADLVTLDTDATRARPVALEAR